MLGLPPPTDALALWCKNVPCVWTEPRGMMVTRHDAEPETLHSSFEALLAVAVCRW